MAARGRMVGRALIAAWLGIVLALAAALPGAFAQQGDALRQIRIEGNQRIEVETIRSYLTVSEGDTFDAVRIDKSLKALFSTGLFADVSIQREGDDLVVKVVENPVINRVAFEGNKHVDSDKLQAEIQLLPRTVFNRTKVQSDVKRLLDLYRRNGRFAATVDPKIVKLEQNRVDLIFEINEGPPTYVTRIDFVGNRKFSDDELKDAIETHEERWYKFFSTDDTYDPDRLNYDREQLRHFYLNHGYADFRVVSAVAQLTPDRKRFFLTFTVDEGVRYKVGKVDVKSALPELKVDELRPVVTVHQGDWYDAGEIENTIQALTDAVGNKGYAFVDIKPVLDRNGEKHIIGITFEIEEGRRVWVERIDIQGNVRTMDKVIRRQFALVEGDAFNSAKLRRSEQRIKDLNFFKTAKVTNVASDTASDLTVIKTEIQEKSTGELTFGVGFSTTFGPLLNVGAAEHNVLGSGDDISINGTLAQRETGVNLGFTDPYFLDRHLIAGFDTFATNTELNNFLSYNTGTTGADVRLGWFYNEYLRHDFTYTASATNVHDIQPGTSQFIVDQAGVTVLSEVSHLLTYDRRDSKIEPTSGYYLKYGNDFAGLGGAEKFVRYTASAGQYFKLADDYVLSLSAKAGYMYGYEGKEINIAQRFYIGGSDLRGFRDFGVTPLDRSTGSPLGAIWDSTGSAELTFPTGLPKEIDVKALLFVDVGTVGPTDPHIPTDQVETSESLRLSVGTGFEWETPVGPVTVDLGVPILRQSYDEIEFFRFNFGTRF